MLRQVSSRISANSGKRSVLRSPGLPRFMQNKDFNLIFKQYLYSMDLVFGQCLFYRNLEIVVVKLFLIDLV